MTPNRYLKTWSYSRWSTYDKCPAQYYYQSIKRLPRETSPALERGKDIHAKAERFVMGEIRGIPNELANFYNEFNALKRFFKKGEGFTEIDLSLDSSWQPSSMKETDYFIGFADYVHFPQSNVATVIDYKTGKLYPGHRDQGHCYGMASLLRDENLARVDVEFWYLDYGTTQKWSWDRSQLEQMKALWARRVEKMHNEKRFEAKPSPLCKWCTYRASNGGPCRHG